MSGRAAAAWWLAVACALSAAGAARGLDATWPGCSTARGSNTIAVVQPGQTNNKITGIHFVNCNFTTVDLDSLKSYPNAKDINLKDIKAASVTTSTFDSLTNLELLTMRNTQIFGNNLPSGLFRNCHKLHYIDLRDNDLPEAPTDLLQGTSQLRTLFLNNCGLRGLPSIFISQVFPNMDFFQANSNGISKLNDRETFANDVNLTQLFLANNNMDYIHDNAFEPLTKISVIRLDHNNLRDIPEPLFQHKAFLSYLDLSHNQIENIPYNAFLGTGLKYLKLNDNKLTHLPGNFFSNLQISGLGEFHFHNNPWDCGCLNKLLVKMKKVIKYDRSQYDGRHQVCVVVPGILINHNNCI